MRPPRSTMQPIGQIANATAARPGPDAIDLAAVAAELKQAAAPVASDPVRSAPTTMSAAEQLAAVRFAAGTERPADVRRARPPAFPTGSDSSLAYDELSFDAGDTLDMDEDSEDIA